MTRVTFKSAFVLIFCFIILISLLIYSTAGQEIGSSDSSSSIGIGVDGDVEMPDEEALDSASQRTVLLSRNKDTPLENDGRGLTLLTSVIFICTMISLKTVLDPGFPKPGPARKKKVIVKKVQALRFYEEVEKFNPVFRHDPDAVDYRKPWKRPASARYLYRNGRLIDRMEPEKAVGS